MILGYSKYELGNYFETRSLAEKAVRRIENFTIEIFKNNLNMED